MPFRYFALLLLLFLAGPKAHTQVTTKAIQPISIPPETLSGLGLPKITLRNHPAREFFQKTIYRGSDLSVYILASETAVNEITNFPFEEFVYYINGKAVIEPLDKAAYSFLAKDYIFVPKGFSGNWTNHGGNQYHLELSVIANRRTDSTQVSSLAQPILLDRERLSGVNLTPTSDHTYRDVLHAGIELTIAVEAELPATKDIAPTKKDQFFQVLAGMVTITPTDAAAQVFYAGDFFILPRGFSGNWVSNGADVLRTLVVTQS